VLIAHQQTKPLPALQVAETMGEKSTKKEPVRAAVARRRNLMTISFQ
jgi:hypothetical protein